MTDPARLPWRPRHPSLTLGRSTGMMELSLVLDPSTIDDEAVSPERQRTLASSDARERGWDFGAGMQKSWSLKMLLALRNGVNPLTVPHPDHPEHTVWTLVTNRLDETLAPWENEPLRHAKSVLGIDQERVFGERSPTAPDFGLRALLSRDWILLAALLWHEATPTSKELDETLDLRDRCKNLHANLDIQMKQIMSASKTALPNASAVWNIIHSNFRTHPFDDVPALVVSALDRHRLAWVGGTSIPAAPARKRSL